MKSRTFIGGSAAALAVTLPYWEALPAVSTITIFQALFGAVVYFLEIAFMLVLIMAVIDGRLKLVSLAAGIGFVVGMAPGISSMPAAIFIPLWLKAAVPATALGIFINRGSKTGWSFVSAIIMMALVMLIMYLQRSEVLIGLINQIDATAERLLTGPAAGSYDAETINRFMDQARFITRVLVRLLPAMMIMSGMTQLFVAFLAAEWYFTHRDSYFPGFGPFMYWKVPEKVLYFLGVVLIVRLTIDGVPQTVADNIAFMMLIVYAVCGLALIEYGLRKLRLPVVVRTLFYLGLGVLLIQVFGLIATAIAGMFDSYFDFRKVRARTIG